MSGNHTERIKYVCEATVKRGQGSESYGWLQSTCYLCLYTVTPPTRVYVACFREFRCVCVGACACVFKIIGFKIIGSSDTEGLLDLARTLSAA